VDYVTENSYNFNKKNTVKIFDLSRIFLRNEISGRFDIQRSGTLAFANLFFLLRYSVICHVTVLKFAETKFTILPFQIVLYDRNDFIFFSH